MRELQIHDAFIAWLRKLDIPYVHHDPTRKSGIRTGWPDFTILFMGRVVCIEVKTIMGRTSTAQEKCFSDIQRSGNKVVIARSVEMCIEACKDILLVGKTLDRRTVLSPRRIAKNLSALGKNNLFIANILGTNWVCQGDPTPGGTAKRVRRATVDDLILMNTND